jgi:hypothetical protein
VRLAIANATVAPDEPVPGRWPLHSSLLLIATASGLLWTLIIAALRWLTA